MKYFHDIYFNNFYVNNSLNMFFDLEIY